MNNFDPDAFLASQQGANSPPSSVPAQGQNFDPDAFIKSQGQSAEGFDPDAFLAEGQAQHYGTPGQQALTGVEGVAQGLAGPLATLAETKLLGVNPEDIAGRERANPWSHHLGQGAGLIGGLIAGTGELAGIVKGASIVADTAKLGKFGSAALKGTLEAAALQGSEEANHYLAGYDPEQTAGSALANMGYAGIMGGAMGGLFGLGDITMSKGLKVLEDTKLQTRAENWLAGYGTASKGIPLTQEEFRQLPADIRHGYKFGNDSAGKIADFALNKIGHEVVGAAGATIGGKVGGVPGSIAGYKASRALIDPMLDRILKRPLTTAAKKYVVPPMLKVLTSGQVKALPAAITYGLKAAKGAKLIDKALDSVLVPGMQSIFSATVDPQTKARINQNIEDETLDQQSSDILKPSTQAFAHGGEVKEQHESFANAFPAESMLLASAKARVYGHLKMLKPQQKPGLIYDSKAPSKEQERVYDQALDLATNPLHIVNHIKNGSLNSGHVLHMNQMWPELNSQLRKNVMNRITEMDQEGKKPPYKIRQSLAILMGTALESAMTPQGILAAQSSFMASPQNSQNQNGEKSKQGETSKIGSKSNQMYKTPNEAAEADAAVRK